MLRMISSVGPGDVAHEEGAVDVVRRSGKELREDVGAVLVRGDVARVNEVGADDFAEPVEAHAHEAGFAGDLFGATAGDGCLVVDEGGDGQ